MAVSNRLRFEVLRRDSYTCRYCGASAPAARLEVDHVQPRKHGGRDVSANLVTACADCNNGKSDTLPEEWLRREIEDAARLWGSSPDDDDDLDDMHAYQEALYFLVELPAGDVIGYIAKVFVAAMPYRPTHDELIRCAAAMARQDVSRRADNQPAKQLAFGVLGKSEVTVRQEPASGGA